MSDLSPPCSYCGATATESDHIPPQSHRHGIIMNGLASRYPFEIVDSCQECNAILGDRPLWTFKDRKAFVKKRLRQRHKRLIKMPPWARDELEELGTCLRGFVSSSVVTREIILERLAY